MYRLFPMFQGRGSRDTILRCVAILGNEVAENRNRSSLFRLKRVRYSQSLWKHKISMDSKDAKLDQVNQNLLRGAKSIADGNKLTVVHYGNVVDY